MDYINSTDNNRLAESLCISTK